MKRIKRIEAILFITILLFTIYFSLFNNRNVVFAANSNSYNQEIKNADSSNANGINEFPSEYQTLLNNLVKKTGHTNWKFKMLYTDLDWNDVIKNETVHLRNTIYKKTALDSSWLDDCDEQGDVGYYCASSDIVKYYMDTRNFLTEETIFQFLDLSNKSPASVETISAVVKGTFLEGSSDGETYAQMIYEAQNESGENAFSILIRIFQELGNGKTLPKLIDGSYGVYNFYNWGANDGNNNIENAVNKAKKLGWTSAKKALIEGAKLISKYYTQAGQVNKYLYKFEVWGKNDSELYSHQYMTNVQDPCSQAATLFSTYNNYNLIDTDLTFVIPVYKNMPSYAKLPPMTENENDNLYFVSSTSSFSLGAVSFRKVPGGDLNCYLYKDTIVTMLQENAMTYNGITYGKISHNGVEGYMSMKYLTKLNKSQSGTTTNVEEGTKYLGEDKKENALVSYKAQLQDIGWTNYASDGETIGTTGQSRRLESFSISSNVKLEYKAHVQDIGWMDPVTNDEMAGTEDKSLRLEAFKINSLDSSYDVLYRAYVQDIGWMDWVKNGEIAGTVGENLRVEAIQIKLEKNSNVNLTGIRYISHSQDYGWLNWQTDGAESGITGQSKRLEALKIELVGDNVSSVENALTYQVHVQDIGWMDWVNNGEMAGTTGQSLRIEAIRIKLSDKFNKNIKYRVHVQDIGWMDWVSNGEMAGTTGQSLRVEAIEIKIE